MAKNEDFTVIFNGTTYRIHYQWDCGMWNADDGTDTGWISFWCQTSDEAVEAAKAHANA